MARPSKNLSKNSSDYFRHRAGLAWVRGDEAAAILLEHKALLRDKYSRYSETRQRSWRITKLITHGPVS